MRTAIAVGRADRRCAALVYFGDTAANAYALDAETGRSRVDAQGRRSSARADHRIADAARRAVSTCRSRRTRNRRAPTRVIACCTFRGSVVALDAATGRVIWKTYDDPGSAAAARHEHRRRAVVGAVGIGDLVGADGRRGARRALRGDGQRLQRARARVERRRRRARSRHGRDSMDAAGHARRRVPEQLPRGQSELSGGPTVPTTTSAARRCSRARRRPRRAGDRAEVGHGFALDPEHDGEVMWEYRAGQGGVLGGIEWGAAVDGEHAYFAVSDILQPKPGGLHAVRAGDRAARLVHAAAGRRRAAPGAGATPRSRRRSRPFPGVVFSGSNDGALRAYSAATARSCGSSTPTRSSRPSTACRRRARRCIGPGPVVAGGMVYVNSGYGAFGGRPGNVLLAFGLE